MNKTMNSKKIERNVLKFTGLFAVGVVLFLGVFNFVGFGQIAGAISQLHVPYYIIAIFLISLSIVTWAIRWSLFTSLSGHDVGFYELLKNLIIGLAINNLTPVFKMGGEAARVYLLKARSGIKGREGLATVSSDLTMELIVDILLAIVAVVFLMIFLSPPFWLYGILIVFVLMSSLIIFGIFGLYTGQQVIYTIINWVCNRVEKLEDYRESIIEKYETFQNTFRTILGNRKVFAQTASLTVTRKVISVAKFYVLFAAFGYQINVFTILIALGVGYMIMMVPATPGSLGIFEGGMVSIFIIMGVPAGIAAAVVFLDRLIWFWAVTGLGSGLGTYYGLDILGGEFLKSSDESTPGKSI